MDRGALDRQQPKPLDAEQTARRACFVLAVALTLPALAQDVRHSVPFFPAAAADVRQGFARMTNHGVEAGEARIFAIDQRGARRGPLRLSINASASAHINSRDLENGNAAKGLPQGVGRGEGDWRLVVEAAPNIEVNAYLRTADGFLTAMHDVVEAVAGRHAVPTFNPASNSRQASHLRVTNPGDAVARVTIAGVDDAGVASGDVTAFVPAGATRAFSAAALERGDGVDGALGDGAGKWRLTVSADGPVTVLSLLESPGGHLANLSTRPAKAVGMRHAVPYFPAGRTATSSSQPQGFVRIVNRTSVAADVQVSAIDDAGRVRGPVPFTVAADATAYFNSDDLERGNAAKGLPLGVGRGEGDWRLLFRSSAAIEVLTYLRSADGFLTAMHDVVPREGDRHVVPTFNPARNQAQVSALRLVNPGARPAAITVAGVDDQGESSGEVSLSLPAGASRTVGAQALEAGEGVAGALGEGQGKWRLIVTSDEPVQVLSLLRSANGRLANLSTRTTVHLPDDGLRAVVREALGKAAPMPLHRAELAALTYLDATYSDIRDLTGLQFATGLVLLHLGGNAIVDVSPLAGLLRLGTLSLHNNRVADLTPLAGLAKLVVLYASGNAITDLAPLSSTLQLDSLYLAGNRVTDVAPLAALTDLTVLDLGHNRLADITALQDLTRLAALSLDNNGIADLAPLANMTRLGDLGVARNIVADIGPLSSLAGLTHLYLQGNRIVDTAPLAGLPVLDHVNLGYNEIEDLAPLVAAGGLAGGDALNVEENPLDAASRETHIPALRRRGVDVTFSPPYPDDDAFPRSRLTRMWGDNVLVMHTEDVVGDIGAWAGHARHFYRWFTDDFDYIILVSNLDDLADSLAPYAGAYESVGNDTDGIGLPRFFDNLHGSGGRLRGVIHIPFNGDGPLLHELHHAWANYAIPTAVGGHWGFSSANGRLGGFDLANLQELGGGRFSAGHFGTFGNGGPYSPIELYLGGFVEAQDVPPLWVAADGAWLTEDGSPVYDDFGNGVFTASDIRRITVDDIIAEHGPRTPDAATAPKRLRAAAILLVDATHPPSETQLRRLSERVTELSHPGADAQDAYNYFEATGGRGFLDMGHLPRFQKRDADTRPIMPSFGAPPPPRHHGRADGPGAPRAHSACP